MTNNHSSQANYEHLSLTNASPPNQSLSSDSKPNCMNQLWTPPPSQTMIPLGRRKLLQSSNLTQSNPSLSWQSQSAHSWVLQAINQPSVHHGTHFSFPAYGRSSLSLLHNPSKLFFPSSAGKKSPRLLVSYFEWPGGYHLAQTVCEQH
jgi:hypothetical protein